MKQARSASGSSASLRFKGMMSATAPARCRQSQGQDPQPQVQAADADAAVAAQGSLCRCPYFGSQHAPQASDADLNSKQPAPYCHQVWSRFGRLKLPYDLLCGGYVRSSNNRQLSLLCSHREALSALRREGFCPSKLCVHCPDGNHLEQGGNCDHQAGGWFPVLPAIQDFGWQ